MQGCVCVCVCVCQAFSKNTGKGWGQMNCLVLSPSFSLCYQFCCQSIGWKRGRWVREGGGAEGWLLGIFFLAAPRLKRARDIVRHSVSVCIYTHTHTHTYTHRHNTHTHTHTHTHARSKSMRPFQKMDWGGGKCPGKRKSLHLYGHNGMPWSRFLKRFGSLLTRSLSRAKNKLGPAYRTS